MCDLAAVSQRDFAAEVQQLGQDAKEILINSLHESRGIGNLRLASPGLRGVVDSSVRKLYIAVGPERALDWQEGERLSLYRWKRCESITILLLQDGGDDWHDDLPDHLDYGHRLLLPFAGQPEESLRHIKHFNVQLSSNSSQSVTVLAYREVLRRLPGLQSAELTGSLGPRPWTPLEWQLLWDSLSTCTRMEKLVLPAGPGLCNVHVLTNLRHLEVRDDLRLATGAAMGLDAVTGISKLPHLKHLLIGELKGMEQDGSDAPLLLQRLLVTPPRSVETVELPSCWPPWKLGSYGHRVGLTVRFTGGRMESAELGGYTALCELAALSRSVLLPAITANRAAAVCTCASNPPLLRLTVSGTLYLGTPPPDYDIDVWEAPPPPPNLDGAAVLPSDSDWSALQALHQACSSIEVDTLSCVQLRGPEAAAALAATVMHVMELLGKPEELQLPSEPAAEGEQPSSADSPYRLRLRFYGIDAPSALAAPPQPAAAVPQGQGANGAVDGLGHDGQQQPGGERNFGMEEAQPSWAVSLPPLRTVVEAALGLPQGTRCRAWGAFDVMVLLQGSSVSELAAAPAGAFAAWLRRLGEEAAAAAVAAARDAAGGSGRGGNSSLEEEGAAAGDGAQAAAVVGGDGGGGGITSFQLLPCIDAVLVTCSSGATAVEVMGRAAATAAMATAATAGDMGAAGGGGRPGSGSGGAALHACRLRMFGPYSRGAMALVLCAVCRELQKALLQDLLAGISFDERKRLRWMLQMWTALLHLPPGGQL